MWGENKVEFGNSFRVLCVQKELNSWTLGCGQSQRNLDVKCGLHLLFKFFGGGYLLSLDFKRMRFAVCSFQKSKLEEIAAQQWPETTGFED